MLIKKYLFKLFSSPKNLSIENHHWPIAFWWIVALCRLSLRRCKITTSANVPPNFSYGHLWLQRGS